MKLIITNGPPRSGKDTLCNLIRENITGHDLIPMSYKKTLYIGVARRYGLSVEAVFEMNADTLIKDEPSPLFEGKSVRQALIYESEEIIKKKYGEQGVAIQTFKLLEEEYGTERLKNAVLYCSDGGFNSELHAAYDYFGICVRDVFIVRLLREGCSFDGDSREFLNNPDIIIRNDSDFAHLGSCLPRIQSFCDGFVDSTSRMAHFRRKTARDLREFWDNLMIQKSDKVKKGPRPQSNRNKGLKPSRTLKSLMDKLHAK